MSLSFQQLLSWGEPKKLREVTETLRVYRTQKALKSRWIASCSGLSPLPAYHVFRKFPFKTSFRNTSSIRQVPRCWVQVRGTSSWKKIRFYWISGPPVSDVSNPKKETLRVGRDIWIRIAGADSLRACSYSSWFRVSGFILHHLWGPM